MKLQEEKHVSLLNKNVGEVILNNPAAAEVLKLLGITIKGNEDKSIIECCVSLQLNEDDVLKSLNKAEKERKYTTPVKFQLWPVSLLIQFIEQEHHAYTRSLLSDANDYEQQVRSIHGPQYPELNQIQWYFEQLSEKLTFHLRFQEEKFFPSAKSFLNPGLKTDGKVRSMEKQIGLVEKDQEEIEYFMSKIEELSNGFKCPETACTTFRLFYSTLRELKSDLEKHHFVENEYLISSIQQRIQEARS